MITTCNVSVHSWVAKDYKFYYTYCMLTLLCRSSRCAHCERAQNDDVSAALSTATKTVSQRSLHRAFHVIEQLDVRITDELDINAIILSL